MPALHVELAEELDRREAAFAGVAVVARLDLDEVLGARVARVDAERELADAALALKDTSVDLGLCGVAGLDLEARIAADLHAFAVRHGVVEHRRPEALRVVELQVPARDEAPHE